MEIEQCSRCLRLSCVFGFDRALVPVLISLVNYWMGDRWTSHHVLARNDHLLPRGDPQTYGSRYRPPQICYFADWVPSSGHVCPRNKSQGLRTRKPRSYQTSLIQRAHQISSRSNAFRWKYMYLEIASLFLFQRLLSRLITHH